MLERLEQELMLIGRRHLLVPKDRDAGRLDRSAYILLNRIDADGPMTIRELTEAFGLDTSTINRQTAALLRCGLVERIPDYDCGPARKLRITAEGARRLAADRDCYRDRIGTVLSGWSEQDIKELTEMLTRLNRTVEEYEGRPWPRR
ncbi:MarR family winged helix-turn-helix transcriptional regulator [Amycolatopsis anabasis]|uniref:MarR family winged helix-turn-helix transcriptional regulator n=1 Tax=Amycolatopsis anabasis TaxID=1840409 RepID=UPI00131B1F74|nr:MarR family winged helix-turn-helix transcriptional regulator [Amycolatopsis anabasis]